ncbi:MAG TPA: BON domain-containing protein [Chloroflexota bacterium]|nr:BON domain-containing protein [Chloroflexota bacterium]
MTRYDLAMTLHDVLVQGQIQSALDVLEPATGPRVQVEVEGGVVYLRGVVVSDWEQAKAERIAREVSPPTVSQIVNELIVNPFLPPLPHP